ncbi:hypothetical protein [Pseudooceanicola onchidii]|uniref:hypothetical protein n=1 Tax=Pseudooceanicola onchidii TaxID=2562279 RepID=UPI0010A9AE61|nr:hypothetical protein [Pseudooceanicola onchidii]
MMPLRLPHSPDADLPQVEAAPFGAEDMNFLNHLRMVALSCRVKPRSNIFEACALIATDPQSTRDAHVEALMRSLSEAMNRRPTLLRTGSTEVSFDEAWLIRLAKSLAHGDSDSAAFLLASRVVPAHRRNIRFLVGRISDCFALV